jgi:hypothetical protein
VQSNNADDVFKQVQQRLTSEANIAFNMTPTTGSVTGNGAGR